MNRIRWAAATAALAFGALAVFALDGPLPRIEPLDPLDTIRSFDLPTNFRVELAACEPDIRSPVAIDFDENGRMFVAEYPEYNQQANPKSTARGCIKVLQDKDNDGHFETVHLYADDIPNPVALFCWDGGVIVGAPPDLWFLKDSKGDGKADIRRKLLTGFDRDRAGEAMLNSFRWTPDNRILMATGLAGGSISRADRPPTDGVSVRNRNVRYDPRTGDFATTSGGGQHGLTLTDWGDEFTCDNSRPILHIAYDARYLERNPYLDAPSPLVSLQPARVQPPLHRLSPPEPWRVERTKLRVAKRFDGPDEGGEPFGFFTAATGIMAYRGDTWPLQYRGQLFVGDVANNLVYHSRLIDRGFFWTAERADSKHEFLASRDVWHRPVQLALGPDGEMYVVDMYRELIETVESMPPELLKQVDPSAGIDRGRIYRVAARRRNRLPQPRMGSATIAQLIASLARPNGWLRDTAARLLYQKQDPAAVAPLRDLVANSTDAIVRMRALYLLDGHQALTPTDVLLGLNDRHPRVREHALRLGEAMTGDAAIRTRFIAMVEDPEPRVLRQLAFSLGAVGQDISEPLARILVRTDDSWVRLGVLSSAADCRATLFERLANDAAFRARRYSEAVMQSLAQQVIAAQRPEEIARLGAVLDGLPANDVALTQLAARAAAERPQAALIPGERAGKQLGGLLAKAVADVQSSATPPTVVVESLRLIGRAPFPDIRSAVRECLSPQREPEVQRAAVELLGRYDDAGVATLIWDAWPGLTPPMRISAVDLLLSRAAWKTSLLDAIAAGTIRPADLDPAQIKLVLGAGDAARRARIADILGKASDRKRSEVLADYRLALDQSGDPARGKAVFARACANCHRLDGQGSAVGPDLATLRGSAPELALISILDPNREILPKYHLYHVATKGGVSMTGMILSESPNSLTLRKIDGANVTIFRADIEQMASTGTSAMPEGLESQIDVAAMADLLSYLTRRQ